jgi:signal transduction histidine kinase
MPAESLRDSASGAAIEIARKIDGGGVSATTRVLIVDIDEATIEKFGRWPLPEAALATLVERARRGAPAAIGFAYVFSGATGARDIDPRLAASLSGGPVVLGTAPSRSAQVFDRGRIPSIPVRLNDPRALEALPRFDRLMPVPDPLLRAAAGVGLLSLQLSHDGIPRRLPMLVRYGGALLPSLPVAMLQAASQGRYVDVEGGPAGLRRVSVGERSVRTDAGGLVWFEVDRGVPHQRVSALDLLEGRFDDAALRGNYVLIGSTAAGVSSEHASADGGLLSGMDALAYSLSALLGGKTYFYPVASLWQEILAAVLIAVFALAMDCIFGARALLLSGAAVIAAAWAVAVFVIARTGQIVDPGLLSVFSVVLFASLTLNKYQLMRREARDQLAAKDREVSSLREDNARVSVAAANPRLSIALSHELRQPLAAARNYLGAIRRVAAREQGGGDRVASYVEEASRQISSMTEIMNELAEIVRGDLTLYKEDHLDAVVLDAVRSTIASKAGEDVRLLTRIEGGTPPVLLNRRQIQLVVSNLARNAIEAPRSRPELVLTVAIRALDPEWVEVSVADTASGIPEAIRDRIFSRFESSKKEGSGIGLPLCRDIVAAHGGEIWFETAAGEGTTFYFTLRRAN